MVTREEIQGKWNEVKGQIQERWGQLTDDDLSRVRGNADQLVGVIQQKTGEARADIEAFLDRVIADGASMASKAVESAREYSQRASESVRGSYEQAAVAFGAGIFTGVVLALVMRTR